jgi:hypothetical protein
MDAATQTVVIIILLLFAIPIVLSDVLRIFHVEEYRYGPMIAGPAFCHTCGAETDGAYYCGPDCYPPDDEEE